MATIIMSGSKRFHDLTKRYGIGNSICGGNATESVALFGYELADDSFQFTSFEYVLKNYGGDPQITPYAPVELYDGDDEIGRKLRIKRYVSDAYNKYPTGNAVYTCVSAIGVLKNMPKHNGGVYTGQTVGSVIAEIFSGSGLIYVIEDTLAAVKLYGRLKRADRRTNLAEILIATGAAIMFDSSGNILIRYMIVNEPIAIQAPYKGSVDIEKLPTYTAVAVTEHAFISLSSDSVKTLFDNSASAAAASGELVEFSEPCHDLQATGSLTISESNANYAIVSGVGTLTGKEYTHTRRIVTQSTGLSGTERTKSLEDVQLVTLVNSDYVAQRMANYYKCANRVKLDMVLNENIKPGTRVKFTDQRGEGTDYIGFIENISYNLNPRKLRGKLSFLAGWTPGPFGSNITTFELLTGSGTWTPPANLTGRVTAVLIGGGNGGQGGTGGSGGDAGSGAAQGDGGTGGAVGTGGDGGKVLQVSFTPSGSYAYSCGAGGIGGAGGTGGAGGYQGISQDVPGSPGNAGDAGSAGAATTFGTYSSESGASGQGYENPLTGEIFGVVGLAGQYAGGDSGQDVEGFVAGTEGSTQTITHDRVRYGASGGLGGGAAYGNNGSNGANGVAYYVTGPPYRIIGIGGNGGCGAAASDMSSAGQTNYGAGGRGGNGGGGGGGGGGYVAFNDNGSSGPGRGGNGGAGGAGSAGNDGAILLFYTLTS